MLTAVIFGGGAGISLCSHGYLVFHSPKTTELSLLTAMVLTYITTFPAIIINELDEEQTALNTLELTDNTISINCYVNVQAHRHAILIINDCILMCQSGEILHTWDNKWLVHRV